jgi:hypothetical protein
MSRTIMGDFATILNAFWENEIVMLRYAEASGTG